MLKRLIFVTGFGAGFVVGSASGRKSYETLKQNALRTWQDPKVQEKVSGGTDWVRAEVPVVGGKLADSAKKAAGTVGAKASDASSTVKEKVSGSSAESSGTASPGTAATTSGTTTPGTTTSGTASSDFADLETAKPVTTDPAAPFPAPGDTPR